VEVGVDARREFLDRGGFARPGAPSTSKCPSASSAMSRRSMSASWPMMLWPSSPRRREKAADAEAVSGMSMKVFRGFADFRTGARAYGQRAAAEVFDKPEKVRSRDAT
jgi:hypothetical protein